MVQVWWLHVHMISSTLFLYLSIVGQPSSIQRTKRILTHIYVLSIFVCTTLYVISVHSLIAN